jgi:hypothetical protein
MTVFIKRNAVLHELDIKEDENGLPHCFSIRFCTRSGEVVYIPRAVTSGAGINRNMANNRERGFLPVDANFHKTGHVYPCLIDNILEYNNMKVRL